MIDFFYYTAEIISVSLLLSLGSTQCSLLYAVCAVNC